MELWMKVAWAAVLCVFIVRLWPVAKQWLEHGPKGSSDDWRGVLLPIAAVVGFVLLLIMLVRGG